MVGNSHLTIAMAVNDDHDGAWHTITSIRNHQAYTPILVINTDTLVDRRLKAFCHAKKIEFHHRPDLSGTAAPRSGLFALAKTDWVMVIDCHIDLVPGAVASALRYCAANPVSRDLIQGPLIYDDGQLATHLRATHPPGLWGTWDTHESIRSKAATGGVINLNTMPAFDIPSQGLGLFMMRRAAWPGFHPLHRGFGGEEGYIHEKVRRLGGRTLCLLSLGWNHRFREVTGAKVSYRLSKEDEVMNLLLTHRELGIKADDQIEDAHVNPVADQKTNRRVWNFSQEKWGRLREEADKLEDGKAIHTVSLKPKLKIAAIWYSNNKAPTKVLRASLVSINAAAVSTHRHLVSVGTCSWEKIPGNIHPWIKYEKTELEGHASILAQQALALSLIPARFDYDAVCFMEHDVLYPADYFDRVGDTLAANPAAPVIVNLDYIGLNQTGWLRTVQRHHPLHQLTLRRAEFKANYARAVKEVEENGVCELEPQPHFKYPRGAAPIQLKSDRSSWAFIPPNETGPKGQWANPYRPPMPAVHINHPHRLTSHGEVCYEKESSNGITHPYWGAASDYWDGKVKSCATCSGATTPVSKDELVIKASQMASDFHEHVTALRQIANQCEHVTEISAWNKAATASLAGSNAKRFVSYCHSSKADWQTARSVRRTQEEFQDKPYPVPTLGNLSGYAGDLPDIEETDLLFLDPFHTGRLVYDSLLKHSPRVKKYIVLHATVPYGEIGEGGGEGMLVGLRRWLKEGAASDWVIKDYRANNYGLLVLSRLEEDRKDEPGVVRKLVNYSKAKAKHELAGGRLLTDEASGKRLDVCLTCEYRAAQVCSACGCPVAKKVTWPTENCGLEKLGLPLKWTRTDDERDMIPLA